MGPEVGTYQDLDSADTESLTSATSNKNLQSVASHLSTSSLVAEASENKAATLVEFSLRLGEMALYVSGQTCKDWWPEQVCHSHDRVLSFIKESGMQ